MDVSDFIAADPVAAETLERLTDALADFEGVTRIEQKSQIKWDRAHPFAALWVPEQYLGRKEAPAVLSIMARHRIESPRFKQVVEPRRNRFTHHLEVTDPGQIDAEVLDWLRAAWKDAG